MRDPEVAYYVAQYVEQTQSGADKYRFELFDSRGCSLGFQSLAYVNRYNIPSFAQWSAEKRYEESFRTEGGKVTETTVAGLMRTFDTGATRNLDDNKLDYEGFLSPLVIDRYAQYMHKHRKLADGTLRDSDNWQKGIPIKQYMKSLWRHVMDVWRQLRGLPGEDAFEESLCAVIFNASGMLYERLKSVRGVSYDEMKARYPELFLSDAEIQKMKASLDSALKKVNAEDTNQ